MATRTFNWCTECQLDCGSPIPTTGYACVPAALVDPIPETTHGYVQVTIQSVRKSVASDFCCGWVYTLTYDDAQLQAGRILQQANVEEVLCTNCLVDFITSRTVDCDVVNECVCFEDTVTVAHSIVEDCNTFDVNVSATEGNQITVEADGLLVPPLDCDAVNDCVCFEESPSIRPNATQAGCTSFDINVSGEPDNQLSVESGGLYVPPQAAGISVDDTASVDLSLVANVLTADVEISADAGNQITIEADGLFVPPVTTVYANWVPVLSSTGGMTVSAVTIEKARYFIIGTTVFFDLAASFTLGGVANSALFVTLPFAAVGEPTDFVEFPAHAEDSSGPRTSSIWRIALADPSRLTVAPEGNTVPWTLGAGGLIGIQGRYELP